MQQANDVRSYAREECPRIHGVRSLMNYSIYIFVLFYLKVPGQVSAVMVCASQSQVSLSWDPPLMPNGIIIAYEVSYRPIASSEPETRVNTTALVTHFTTENNLEEDTEFFFSVRAYTRVGPGNTSSLTVSTLLVTVTKSCMLNNCCVVWNSTRPESDQYTMKIMIS